MDSTMRPSNVWSPSSSETVCSAPSDFAASFGFAFGSNTCDAKAALGCWQNSTASIADGISTTLIDFTNAALESSMAVVSSNGSAPEPVERRVSRQVLFESLEADTVPRMLVRWGVAGTAHLSPHASILLSYAVWWAFPDLIVPVSVATVDLQLGYVTPKSLHVSDILLSFGATSAHSEWYGMLRRLERQNSWLPQADDGTPLVLQSTMSSQPLPPVSTPKSPDPLSELGGNWHTLLSKAGRGLRILATYLYSASLSLLQQLWTLARLGTNATSKVVGHWVQGTPVEAMVATGAQQVVSVAQLCMSALEPT
ncbi:hypothetical protein IWW38_006149, partial [Coemansia aciculifera]